jgi:hypothetical protein
MEVPQFQKGDVAFIMHNKETMARIMAWFMGSQWSHSNIVTKPTDEYTFVSETSDFTVTVGWLERYITDPTVSMEVWRITDLDPALGAQIAATCMANYNILYGYLQLISWFFVLLLAKIGITIPNFIHQGLLCDQNILTGLNQAPIPGIQGVAPKSVETQKLYAMIVNSGAFTKIYEQAEQTSS